jgi:molecular chaperone GrpE
MADIEDYMPETTPGAEAIEGDEIDPGSTLAKLMAENSALKDQAMRYAAEVENVKRRAEKEANDARAYAIQKFARDLLDPSDNLRQAVQHAPKGVEDAAVKNFVMGVEMSEKALQTAFERNGLKRVTPERGEKFDPNKHQAMMEQEAEGVAPGAVITVMQPGYELFGRLIRPAMVAVTPKASAPTQPADGAYAQAEASASAGATFDAKA